MGEAKAIRSKDALGRLRDTAKRRAKGVEPGENPNHSHYQTIFRPSRMRD
jgi:hypothetical protein